MAKGGTSTSTTSSSTSVSTVDIADAFNTNYSEANTLSNLGNVSVSGGDGGATSPVLLAGVAVLGLAAILWLKRKR